MRIVLDSLAVRLTVPALSDAELAELRVALPRDDRRGQRRRHRRPTTRPTAGSISACSRTPARGWNARFRISGTTPSATGGSYCRIGGVANHLLRLADRDHAGILEAAQSRDACVTAKRMAEHLARTALMTLVQTDHRHDPVRVRAALEHVYAEDPTAAGPRAADLPGAAAG